MPKPFLSIVIPAYNEKDNVAPLLARIQVALSQVSYMYEIIIIDDNSTDGSMRVLKGLARRHTTLRILRKIGERGKASSLLQGF